MDNNNESRNIILAIVLSLLVVMGWNYFTPNVPPVNTQNVVSETNITSEVNQTAEIEASDVFVEKASVEEILTRNDRINISTPKLTGSISLVGARIDSLILNDYKVENTPDSPNVRLLSPRGTEKPYFVDTGWVGVSSEIPNSKTVWATNDKTLGVNSPVVLKWINKNGVEFKKTYTIDENYLINVKQSIVNNSNASFNSTDYALIARGGIDEGKMDMYILHDGPIGVLDSTLEEVDYSDVKDDKKIPYNSNGGWIGFTDQFWLVGLIPEQQKSMNATFRYINATGLYQADFKNQGVNVPAGSSTSYDIKVFAGAKEVNVIDVYEEQYNIPMFDRSIDFGWFYFLTKPFFHLLHFLSGVIGNVGFAILALTLIVKAVLFPLANKSYRSMAKMKVLAPKMEEMKKRYGDDRQAMTQAMMKLYKEENVNPMSGCLPMLIQIPIFFSLYKVLFVTLEIRHEPFIGWVTDLSAPDSLTILTGFGLFDWNVPDYLALVNLGVWPILMGISMWAQFKLNPAPQDPIQAKVFAFMPIIFTFMLATFPVGLVIYWTWNNVLSIIQQYTIQKKITG